MPHFDNINSNISKLHADLNAAGLAVVGICHEAPDFVRVDWPEGMIPSKTLIDQQNAIVTEWLKDPTAKDPDPKPTRLIVEELLTKLTDKAAISPQEANDILTT